MILETYWKITGPLLNSSVCHFTVTWWNVTSVSVNQADKTADKNFDRQKN
jgi:hypothetical protein